MIQRKEKYILQFTNSKFERPPRQIRPPLLHARLVGDGTTLGRFLNFQTYHEGLAQENLTKETRSRASMCSRPTWSTFEMRRVGLGTPFRCPKGLPERKQFFWPSKLSF